MSVRTAKSDMHPQNESEKASVEKPFRSHSVQVSVHRHNLVSHSFAN